MKLKHFLYLIMIIAMAISISPLTLFSAENETGAEIPDYSLTGRKDIPPEYTWRVEDIYPTLAEWEKANTQVTEMMGQLETMSSGWTGSPKSMLALLDHVSTIFREMSKLIIYAELQGDSDLGNPLFQQMKGKAQNLNVQLDVKLAFMDADVLKLGQEAFEQYVQKEPGLKPYSFQIEKTLREKTHILPVEEEKIYSYSGLFSNTPKDVSGILNNVELPQPEITLPDGKKITLNYANYALYRGDKNPAVRKLAMSTYWENHKKFENTFATLLNGAVNEHFFDAHIHHYTDCLESKL
ncbi:MAG: hypothetical protein EHM45_24210, partial [Desulfobacteraceae bacterium]